MKKTTFTPLMLSFFTPPANLWLPIQKKRKTEEEPKIQGMRLLERQKGITPPLWA